MTKRTRRSEPPIMVTPEQQQAWNEGVAREQAQQLDGNHRETLRRNYERQQRERAWWRRPLTWWRSRRRARALNAAPRWRAVALQRWKDSPGPRQERVAELLEARD